MPRSASHKCIYCMWCVCVCVCVRVLLTRPYDYDCASGAAIILSKWHSLWNWNWNQNIQKNLNHGPWASDETKTTKRHSGKNGEKNHLNSRVFLQLVNSDKFTIHFSLYLFLSSFWRNEKQLQFKPRVHVHHVKWTDVR